MTFLLETKSELPSLSRHIGESQANMLRARESINAATKQTAIEMQAHSVATHLKLQNIFAMHAQHTASSALSPLAFSSAMRHEDCPNECYVVSAP